VSVSGSESAAPPSSPVGSSSAELPQVDSGPSIPQTTLPAAASSMLPPSQAPSTSAGSVGSQRQSDSTPFHGSRDVDQLDETIDSIEMHELFYITNDGT